MADTAKLRQENLNVIRRILLAEQGFTKQEIAARTGLSQATCNTLLNVLARHGEVQSEQRRTGSVGRSSAVYRINEAYACILNCWKESAGPLSTGFLPWEGFWQKLMPARRGWMPIL